MTGPSVFDWLIAIRRQPNGRRIPWLETRRGQRLLEVPGSVLALHVPSQASSGRGRLVIDERLAAAFITEMGVCWEIGPLADAVKETFVGADGTLQIYLSRPTGLHLTFETEAAHQLQAILDNSRLQQGRRASPTYEGDDMGLFSRKSAMPGQPDVALPQGEVLPPGTDLETYLVSTALSKTPRSGVPSEDIMAYSEAGYATVLGIPESDTAIAWGAARIRTPQDDREREGTVVLTHNTVLAYWQPGRTSLIHTFQANHSAIVGMELPDEHSIVLGWEIGEYANNEGKFLVGEPAVSLAPSFGKDPHANRRALTWFYTLRFIASQVT